MMRAPLVTYSSFAEQRLRTWIYNVSFTNFSVENSVIKSRGIEALEFGMEQHERYVSAFTVHFVVHFRNGLLFSSLQEDRYCVAFFEGTAFLLVEDMFLS